MHCADCRAFTMEYLVHRDVEKSWLFFRWQLSAPRNNDDHLCQAALSAFAGEPRKAADAMQPIVASRQSPFCDFLMTLLLDEAGETRRRDQALKALDPKNPYKPLADFFIASLAKGEAAAVDLVAAEKVLKAMSLTERRNSYYFLGRFLELRGQQNAARDYYQRRLAEEPFSNQITTALAGSRLHATLPIRVISTRSAGWCSAIS